MTRKPLVFTIGLIFVGFLFVLIPAKSVLAGQCKVIVNFQAQPNPVPANGTLTLSGYVDMTGSIWEAGNSNAGFCYDTGGTILKTVNVQVSGLTTHLADIAINLEASRTTAYSFSKTIQMSGYSASTYPGGGFDVKADVYNSNFNLDLATSQSIHVNVSAAVNGARGCVADDGKYACSPTNDSKCSDTIDPNTKKNVCDGKTCMAIPDSTQCGKQASTTASHKECQNNSCVNAPGSGTDACTTIGQSCSAGGGKVATQSYSFNLLNPIGVTDFQDLINIIGKWIFNLAIPIAVIIIIYAGVLMLTAGGVPARFQKGAKALWYAVLGLAVVLIGKGFVTLVQSILSLKNK